tara:strand:+ start:1041 stop:1412 length:372 start_codon:yes stop_codon:yes gene_type:complete
MNNFIKFTMVVVIALGAVGLAYPLFQSQGNSYDSIANIEPAAGGSVSSQDDLRSILQRSYVRANLALEEAQRALEESNNFVDSSMGIQTPSDTNVSVEDTASFDDAEFIQFLNDLEPAAGQTK